MSAIVNVMLSNAVVVAILFCALMLLRRWIRNPAVFHGLAVLLLVKLLVPWGWQPTLDVLPRADSAVETPAVSEDSPTSAHADLQVETVRQPDIGIESVETEMVATPPAIPALPATSDTHHSSRQRADRAADAPRWTFQPAFLIGRAWLIGTTVWLLIAVRRIMTFRKSLRLALPAPAELQELATTLARRLGLKRAPQVVLVPGQLSPVLWSLGGRPQIILSAGLLDRLDDGERQSLLLHELAHYRRGDHLVRLVELAATGIFWWYPVLWWLRRELRLAEELCCDAWVVESLPDQRRAYAEALVKTAGWLSTPAIVPGTTGIGSTHHIEQRITRIMRDSLAARVPARLKAVMALLAVGVMSCAPMLGQSAAAPVHDDPAVAQAAADTSGNIGADTGLDLYGDPLPDGAVSRLGTVRYRHREPEYMEFVSGTSTVAVGGIQKAVSLIDATTGRRIRAFDFGADGLDAFRTSWNGETIVTLSHAKIDPILRISHASLSIWDAETGDELRRFAWADPFRMRCVQLALSTDGRTAAIGTHDGFVRIWDLARGEELDRRKLTRSEVRHVEFSPDDNQIAVTDWRDVVLWEHASDNEPRKLEGLERRSPFFRFSPDGRILAVGGEDSIAAQLYDVKSGRRLGQLTGDSARDYSPRLCFADEGRQLIVSARRTVDVFDVSAARVVRSLDTGGRGVGAVSLSSDGRLMAGASGAKIIVWDMSTGERINDRFTGHFLPPTEIEFTLDDRHVVTAGIDGTIRVWDPNTGRQLRVFSDAGWVSGMAFSPDGRWLATCGPGKSVRLWEFASGQERYRIPGHGRVGSDLNVKIAFSGDGEQFHSFGPDLYLRTYSVQTGRALAEHALRPSGMQIVEGEEGRLELTGGPPHGPVSSALQLAAWSSDGAVFLLSTLEGVIYLFDTTTGEETGVIKPAPEWWLNFGRFTSPRNGRFATIERLVNEDGVANDRGIHGSILRLRDLASGDVINEVLLEGKFTYRLAVSPDGKLIAAAESDLYSTPDADRWVDVWETDTLNRIAHIPTNTPTQRAHVRGIGFSHDGKRIATSHDDSNVTVWDLSAFREN